jgi:O-methyltransferase
MKRRMKYAYEFDGMATIHNLLFLQDERYKCALTAANVAGGFDYEIYLRLHQAIWCADKALALSNSAAFVELGTGKGYVMTGILQSLSFLSHDHKNPVFLFDTFESSATDRKGLQDPKYGKHRYYCESFQSVEKNFVRFPQVKLIRGLLPASLGKVALPSISFLHIDLNSPEVEIETLKTLWPNILCGGVILIDDYAYAGYEYTYQLFNSFATEFGVSILTTASGQGIIIK